MTIENMANEEHLCHAKRTLCEKLSHKELIIRWKVKCKISWVGIGSGDILFS